jgi:hypothetical protein
MLDLHGMEHVRKPRSSYPLPVDEEPPRAGGHGAEYAPTRRAQQAEARRHAEERARGHLAAGVGGRIKAEQLELNAKAKPSSSGVESGSRRRS